VKTLPADDYLPGVFVTIEQAWFMDFESKAFIQRGWGQAWIGPDPDLRNHLFKIIRYEHPMLLLEWLATASGDLAKQPKRVVFDTRYVKLRKISEEFAQDMLAAQPAPRQADPVAPGGFLHSLFEMAAGQGKVEIQKMEVPNMTRQDSPSVPKRPRRKKPPTEEGPKSPVS